MPLNRKRKALRDRLSRRLAGYALAGVAGIELGSPQNADAAVVYTPARQFGLGTYDGKAIIPIDLNHDGLTDFTLVGLEFSDFSSGGLAHTAIVYVSAGSGNKITKSGSFLSEPEAQAQREGQRISPALPFESLGRRGLLLAFNFGGPMGGNFYNVKNRFLALELQSNGQTHYGWARVNLKTAGGTFLFELVDYAYQSTPNVPIRAGEGIPEPSADSLPSGTDSTPQASLSLSPDKGVPATLGMLAYGSDALPAWRR